MATASSPVTKVCDLGEEEDANFVGWAQPGFHLTAGTKQGKVQGSTNADGSARNFQWLRVLWRATGMPLLMLFATFLFG
ncbi:unnamed protein product [Urochloa humidicola]